MAHAIEAGQAGAHVAERVVHTTVCIRRWEREGAGEEKEYAGTMPYGSVLSLESANGTGHVSLQSVIRDVGDLMLFRRECRVLREILRSRVERLWNVSLELNRVRKNRTQAKQMRWPVGVPGRR